MPYVFPENDPEVQRIFKEDGRLLEVLPEPWEDWVPKDVMDKFWQGDTEGLEKLVESATPQQLEQLFIYVDDVVRDTADMAEFPEKILDVWKNMKKKLNIGYYWKK